MFNAIRVWPLELILFSRRSRLIRSLPLAVLTRRRCIKSNFAVFLCGFAPLRETCVKE